MKKLIYIIILFIFLLNIKDIYAKDTVHSIKKYKEGNLFYLKDSYNRNHIIDGYVTSGTYLNDDNHSQVIFIKYSNNQIKWLYTNPSNIDNYLIDLVYTYDSEKFIDGYLLVIEENNHTKFLKINLDGKLVSEIEIEEKIEKIIPTYDNTIVNGYILITNNSKILLFNKELNLVKEIPDQDLIPYKDITYLKEDNTIIGYVILREKDILLVNLNGERINTIELDPSYLNTSLYSTNNGFILYGITNEVKLKDGNSTYFLIGYDKDGKELLDSIGKENVDSNKSIKLISNDKDYLLLIKNDKDRTYEVIQLDEYGLYQKKIKKFNSNYYTFNDYSTKNDTLYFVGQINCPEKDNCDYKNKLLFLVSDEDKVIEVEDKDSTNILLSMIMILSLLLGGVIIHKKRKI